MSVFETVCSQQFTFFLASKVSTTSANRTEILSKLSQLPPTSHVTASFAIDVPLVTSTIVKFIVRGLYEESKFEIVPGPGSSILTSKKFDVHFNKSLLSQFTGAAELSL